MELKQRQGLSPTLWLCQNDVWPGVNLCPEGRAGNHYSSPGRQEGKLRLAFCEDTRARACPLLIDMCHLQWRQPKSIWGILLSASQERNSEGAAGSLAKQSGVQFPERDHSVFVGTREGAWVYKEVEGQSGNCIFLFTASGSSSFQCGSIVWKLGVLKNPLWILYGGLFSAFLLPRLFALRARGEKMIKSSWFYVKFKYSDKVSQYIFFSQGKPASPCSLMLTGLVVTLGGEGAREC